MKRLVICSDGTWNTPDQKDQGVVRPTNVVKVAECIAPRTPDGTEQVVFYDEGVGTHWGLDRLTGGAFGHGLSTNVKDAYRFLVCNYCDGDEIYLFGFSRGAYTVRSAVGLIRNCGILHKHEASRIPEAYALYRRRDAPPDAAESQAFRLKYSRQARITCLGVWDTVGALGIPVRGLRWLTRKRHQFHDVTLSRIVDHAYHALAIDERRRPFAPAIWHTQTALGQVVEQVWFAGVHSNVGGGYKDAGLSDLALEWMLAKAQDCGLAVSQTCVAGRLEPNHRGVLRNSKKGLYRLTGDWVRPMGQAACGTETVHASALLRRDAKGLDYHPPNLEAFLAH